MTAPVIIAQATATSDEKVMQFILPSEYDNISKLPKPTNSTVSIREIKPEVGAIH